MNQEKECIWLERVSLMLDGAVQVKEEKLILQHARGCVSCRILLDMSTLLASAHVSSEVSKPNLIEIPDRSFTVRLLLGCAGLVLLTVAVFNFIKGSSGGHDLHDLRHLAVWQASLGVAVLSLTIAFRFSLFIIVTSVSLIGFTTISAIVDVLMGHRGPWADITHLLEAAVLALVLIAVLPRVQWTRRLQHREKISRRKE